MKKVVPNKSERDKQSQKPTMRHKKQMKICSKNDRSDGTKNEYDKECKEVEPNRERIAKHREKCQQQVLVSPKGKGKIGSNENIHRNTCAKLLLAHHEQNTEPSVIHAVDSRTASFPEDLAFDSDLQVDLSTIEFPSYPATPVSTPRMRLSIGKDLDESIEQKMEWLEAMLLKDEALMAESSNSVRTNCDLKKDRGQGIYDTHFGARDQVGVAPQGKEQDQNILQTANENQIGDNDNGTTNDENNKNTEPSVPQNGDGLTASWPADLLLDLNSQVDLSTIEFPSYPATPVSTPRMRSLIGENFDAFAEQKMEWLEGMLLNDEALMARSSKRLRTDYDLEKGSGEGIYNTHIGKTDHVGVTPQRRQQDQHILQTATENQIYDNDNGTINDENNENTEPSVTQNGDCLTASWPADLVFDLNSQVDLSTIEFPSYPATPVSTPRMRSINSENNDTFVEEKIAWLEGILLYDEALMARSSKRLRTDYDLEKGSGEGIYNTYIGKTDHVGVTSHRKEETGKHDQQTVVEDEIGNNDSGNNDDNNDNDYANGKNNSNNNDNVQRNAGTTLLLVNHEENTVPPVICAGDGLTASWPADLMIELDSQVDLNTIEFPSYPPTPVSTPRMRSLNIDAFVEQKMTRLDALLSYDEALMTRSPDSVHTDYDYDFSPRKVKKQLNIETPIDNNEQQYLSLYMERLKFSLSDQFSSLEENSLESKASQDEEDQLNFLRSSPTRTVIRGPRLDNVLRAPAGDMTQISIENQLTCQRPKIRERGIVAPAADMTQIWVKGQQTCEKPKIRERGTAEPICATPRLNIFQGEAVTPQKHFPIFSNARKEKTTPVKNLEATIQRNVKDLTHTSLKLGLKERNHIQEQRERIWGKTFIISGKPTTIRNSLNGRLCSASHSPSRIPLQTETPRQKTIVPSTNNQHLISSSKLISHKHSRPPKSLLPSVSPAAEPEARKDRTYVKFDDIIPVAVKMNTNKPATSTPNCGKSGKPSTNSLHQGVAVVKPSAKKKISSKNLPTSQKRHATILPKRL